LKDAKNQIDFLLLND